MTHGSVRRITDPHRHSCITVPGSAPGSTRASVTARWKKKVPMKIAVTLWTIVALATPAYAQLTNSLAAARDLYASARYDEALAVLNGMRPADGAGLDRKSVEQYRSLCLLALGRGTEAESAIAAVVTVDPLFIPAEADASPRVRTAFSDVRQRLLPQIASSHYTAAKAAFDRKEYASAERQFKALASLLDDPQMGGRLSDLRVLVSGFLDLASAAVAPPPEPKKEEPVAPAPPSPSAQIVMSAPHIWTGDETGVTLPVIIRQNVPAVPLAIASQTRDNGLLEIVIDEQGRVTMITVRSSMHGRYDQLLMAAAREWRYRPAMVNGVPVKFRKLIQVKVTK
jgi:TonB family protein